jgi:hypothetical protein
METLVSRNDSEETGLLPSLTNDVLVEQLKDKTVYYLPCYARIKVKAIKSFEVETLSGVISATLLFSFYHGSLPSEVLEQFVREGSKAIILQFPRQESIELRESNEITLKDDPNNKIIDFVMRTEFECNLEGDVFYTPFEMLNLYLSVTVQTLILDPKQNDGKIIHIKFNCMNSDKVTTIDAGSKLEHGTYALAEYFLDSDYTNSPNHRFLPVSVSNPDEKIGVRP